jgi:hypothetical protein
MKKHKLIILFIFIKIGLCSKEVDFGISPYLFAPSSFSVTSTVTFATNIGISSGIYYTNYLRVNLSRIISPEIKISFFSDERILDRFSIRNNFSVCKFFSASQGYTFWNYSKYKIVEHNLFTTLHLQLPVKNILTFIIGGGGNIKIIDYNIEKINKSKNDYSIHLAPILKLEALFYPTNFYNVGLKLSNVFDDDLISIGNFQLELMNYFFPQRKKIWSIEVNTGIGFAGSGSLAGYPNQFWIAIGGTYEHFFKN